MPAARIAKIVSGGQTGVDRAALDAGIAIGIPYGGWCPKGGLAEDMPDPPGLLEPYPELTETPSDDVSQRTEWNVRDSDATLIIRPEGSKSPGTDLTIELAARMNRPCRTVDPESNDAVAEVLAFIESIGPEAVLNVAGPRESGAPGIYEAARDLLTRSLSN
ncbi:MAG: putative molybdenum carrier protein [Solirubrobacterales bacterium]|nr:putative molybdenum carrier protein [Solirubrobacterales bacterium]MCB0863959.1 putative molybdenum carrier protein [Solirubrobacterales bacterium]HRV58989.1 putative molybdenum carrier protein [Solirubrobacterales bacterium]